MCLSLKVIILGNDIHAVTWSNYCTKSNNQGLKSGEQIEEKTTLIKLNAKL